VVRIQRLREYLGTRNKPYKLLFIIGLILLLKGAVTCSNISIVDYIVGEKPTKALAARQLKSSAVTLTSALLSRNLDAKHNIFFFARSST
jgi:hypothetical protein